MATLGVRFSIRGRANLDDMIAEAESINGKQVIVGPTGARNRDLAKIHEYGIVINVTPKMRAFLASQGLHLKASTNTITIPERSFMRAGWDSNYNSIMRRVTEWATNVALGSMSSEELLDKTGQLTVDAIKNYARDLDSPSNHPFTIEQKGFDDPLIESGSMVGSIDYETR